MSGLKLDVLGNLGEHHHLHDGKTFKELVINSSADINFSQSVSIKEGEEKLIIQLYNEGINLEKILEKLNSNGFKNSKFELYSKIRSIPELRPLIEKDQITLDQIENFKREVESFKKEK